MSAGTSSGTVTATLQPALENAATAIGGLDVSHWKLSRDWKAQIQQDIDSIQQDLSGNLPALLQAAQKSPAALTPQITLMHNVDAFYDVLVRVSMAADLTGSRADASALDNALAQLETARKNAAAEILATATQRDALMQRVEQAAQASRAAAAAPPKTIIVDDTGRSIHHSHHVVHKKQPAAAPTANGPQ